MGAGSGMLGGSGSGMLGGSGSGMLGSFAAASSLGPPPPRRPTTPSTLHMRVGMGVSTSAEEAVTHIVKRPATADPLTYRGEGGGIGGSGGDGGGGGGGGEGGGDGDGGLGGSGLGEGGGGDGGDGGGESLHGRLQQRLARRCVDRLLPVRDEQHE